MKYLLLILALLFTNACSTLSQLSIYTVSESEIEQLLDNQLANLQTNASLAGIPLLLEVNEMTVEIGPDGRDVVQLGTDATAKIEAFGLSYPISVSLSLEGTPYYDSEQKAIYVRSLALLDSTVDAGGYRGNLAPLSGEFMQVLNAYLASNPVHTLDASNKAVSLLSTIPLELTVEQGQLALRPKR
ncbi:DUF1439 domain-containing protein [Glaciecola sp. XM2]|uniref:DUF1439 domain-containing protein n=1 Tax=Glaciecola sp. XM2 TaxID=1914931 RepID=UPI001BDEC6ED|nr:DUF1439 domain-containing protein [Glaciecola sp. XM2]MBT1451298.1 DUF1439 domain-containing protein [Glaciecola sp. XM2]